MARGLGLLGLMALFVVIAAAITDDVLLALTFALIGGCVVAAVFGRR